MSVSYAETQEEIERTTGKPVDQLEELIRWSDQLLWSLEQANLDGLKAGLTIGNIKVPKRLLKSLRDLSGEVVGELEGRVHHPTDAIDRLFELQQLLFDHREVQRQQQRRIDRRLRRQKLHERWEERREERRNGSQAIEMTA